MTDSRIQIGLVDPDTDDTGLWTLLTEYQEWLAEHAPMDYDPEFGIEKDRRSLAAKSEGWAWVAHHDGTPAGCVLLYGETDDLAEFRRLWVRPDHRGHDVGRRLTETVIEEARTQGYETLGLTTPPWSEAAQALYESLGFERTPPYPETRLDEQYHEDAIFMQLDLTDIEVPIRV